MKEHPGKFNLWTYIRSWWEESELPVSGLLYKARCSNRNIEEQRAFCLFIFLAYKQESAWSISYANHDLGKFQLVIHIVTSNINRGH